MNKTLVLAGGLAVLSAPALANHANPWATEDDEVLAQFHDVNQAKSIGTPGEDEQNGRMNRSAFGKLGGAGDTKSGEDAGRGRGDERGR